jgi:serine/threonine-protein kinase
MVSIDGRILLTDFGIAQAPEARGSERLTRTGIFMGTPEYISPEQASAQRVDGRSDLYSLGITAYEIITGKVPFSGATPQLMLAHLQLPPPPLSSVIADQPPELDLVLARALAKSPDKRYATGAAFVTALREVARSYQIIEATTTGLALLAQPESSSGQLTQLGQTKPAPPPVRPPKPPVPDHQLSTPPPVKPPDPNVILDKPVRPIDWRIVVPIAIGVILLVILALSAVIGSGPRPITPLIPSPSFSVTAIVPTKQPTSTPNPTAIPPATLLPSAMPTEIPTPTPRPTRRPAAPTEVPVEIPTEFIPEPTIEIPTDFPTETPTETIVPITDIPVATTAVPLPTTVVPVATTAIPIPTTVVPVPPTVVPVPTTAVAVLPTAVPPTATSIPPTATVDVPTATSVPPTATINIPTVTLTLTP